MRLHSRTALALAGTGALALTLAAAGVRSAHGATSLRPSNTVEQSVAGAVFEAINDSKSKGGSSGILGIATGGSTNIGVGGYSGAGEQSGIGIYGSALGPNATAVFGRASDGAAGQHGTGVEGLSLTGNGIYGLSMSNDGVVGETQFKGTTANHSSGLLGVDRTGSSFSTGVSGGSSSGAGVEGVSVAGNGGGFETNSNAFAALVAISNTAGSPPFVAENAATGAQLVFDDAGDLTISGTLTYVSGGTQKTLLRMRGASAANNRQTQSFGTQASRPQIEDVGESRAVNGVAVVAIDAALANAIDTTPYSVFVTPEGDNNGVYVTQKTARSFVVRETHGGRSSFAFAYRIVAHPAGAGNVRLPQAAPVDSARFAVPSGGSARPAELVRHLSVLPQTRL